MNRAGTATAITPTTATVTTASPTSVRMRRRGRVRRAILGCRLLRVGADEVFYITAARRTRTLLVSCARRHHVAQGSPGHERVERIARHEDERGRARIAVDHGGSGIDDRELLHEEPYDRAARRFHEDLVPTANPFEKAKVRVAMRRHDLGPRRAGRCAVRRVAGTEGQGPSTHTREHDEIDAVGWQAEPRDRPRIRRRLAAERPLPGPLKEKLSEPGLGVDPGAVAQLPQADHGEQGHGADQEPRAFQIFLQRRVVPARAAARRSATSPKTRWAGASVAPCPMPKTAV